LTDIGFGFLGLWILQKLTGRFLRTLAGLIRYQSTSDTKVCRFTIVGNRSYALFSVYGIYWCYRRSTMSFGESYEHCSRMRV